jgi:hypothetical protein
MQYGISVNFYQITRRHIPEETDDPNHLCENLKSYKLHFDCTFSIHTNMSEHTWRSMMIQPRGQRKSNWSLTVIVCLKRDFVSENMVGQECRSIHHVGASCFEHSCIKCDNTHCTKRHSISKLLIYGKYIIIWCLVRYTL